MIQRFQLLCRQLTVPCRILCLLLQTCHLFFSGIQYFYRMFHIVSDRLCHFTHGIYFFLNSLRLCRLLLNRRCRLPGTYRHLLHGCFGTVKSGFQFIQFRCDISY